MQAEDLRAALNILDPEHPLSTPEELAEFFVPRPDSPLEDLKILLEDTDKPQKFLFTGHRGSGKSTELAKLTQGLGDDFFIIRYSIKSILNLFDLSYVDVVLSLALKLFEKATDEKIKVKPEVLHHILDFTKEITKEVVTGIDTQAEVGAELNLYVVKLTSKLGTEDTTRTSIREKVQSRLSDLLESVAFLAEEIKRVTGRKLLAIVEDLDKADLDTAKQLFYSHATSLLAPPISIIYTFPTALRHDNDFMQIEMNFPNVCILPNLKTRLHDGTPDETGAMRLRAILTKRVSETLFAPDVPERLAELSSGIPRELIALSRYATLEARKMGHPNITLKAVERAARRKRMDYEVLLTSKQLNLLRKIHETKIIENDEAHRALLHNLSALEYRNSRVWYDVHPLVEPLLPEAS